MKFPCIDHERKGDNCGYTNIYHNGKVMGYHRAVFLQTYGYLPRVVMHLCDNPRCINPLHLAAGTHQSNSRDMVAKGRNVCHRKLADWQVVQIREAAGTQRDIASRYGVSQTTVANIRAGKVYGRV